MEDRAAEKSSHIKAWLMPVRRGNGSAVQSDLVKRAAKEGAEVLVLDAAMVFGLDHIRAAFCHASDAMEGGRSVSDSLAMEVLLYASGERQLSTAIKKMSVSDSTGEVLIAWLGGKHLTPDTGWVELTEGFSGFEDERLVRFGITEQELKTVPQSKRAELVFERVAAVEILKK